MKNTQILKKMITDNRLITAPGVFDGLSGLLAKKAGFSVLYASGGAIARAAGFPDLNLLTMTEVCSVISQIVCVTQLPVIADADTGFGNALNVSRTVREFEKTGVAGLHFEDQAFPKRCGHLNDKTIISSDEMCQKIAVARKFLQDPDFVLIARTDAIAVEGIDAAIQRAQQYLQAGADVIFVEAPETIAQIELIAEKIKQPKLINMFSGGKTPRLPAQRLEQLGYGIMIIPSDLQRAAIKAMQNTLQAIMETGDSDQLIDQMVSFKEREKIVETEKYLEIGTTL